MPSHKWWFWSQFGYGNSFLHTIVAKTVFRKCASHRRRGAHFYKHCKKIKKNHANKHQKSIVLKEITEIGKMNWKSWLQNSLRSKKCPRPTREQHFYWFLLAEEDPVEGDWKGYCTQKGVKTIIFEGTLLRIVFQKCASHRGRRAHFWKKQEQWQNQDRRYENLL